MSGTMSKNKKQSNSAVSGNVKLARVLFAILAIILILSMVLSAVTSY